MVRVVYGRSKKVFGAKDEIGVASYKKSIELPHTGSLHFAGTAETL